MASQSTTVAEPLPGHLHTLREISLKDTFVPQAIVLLALLLLLYGHIVANLVNQWFEDPNYSHGFFVPICVALLLWIHRKTWMGIPLQPSTSGLLFVVAAMGLLVVGMLGAEIFLPRVSLCL